MNILYQEELNEFGHELQSPFHAYLLQKCWNKLSNNDLHGKSQCLAKYAPLRLTYTGSFVQERADFNSDYKNSHFKRIRRSVLNTYVQPEHYQSPLDLFIDSVMPDSIQKSEADFQNKIARLFITLWAVFS